MALASGLIGKHAILKKKKKKTPFLLKTMERLVDHSIRMGPLKRSPLERS
jgi:hypothetical protein